MAEGFISTQKSPCLAYARGLVVPLKCTFSKAGFLFLARTPLIFSPLFYARPGMRREGSSISYGKVRGTALLLRRAGIRPLPLLKGGSVRLCGRRGIYTLKMSLRGGASEPSRRAKRRRSNLPGLCRLLPCSIRASPTPLNGERPGASPGLSQPVRSRGDYGL